jgi:hypothetical protein
MEQTRHDARASTDDVTLRFGPGVPPALANTWKGGNRRRPLARRIGGGLLTLAIAVLAGLAVWWLLRGGGPDVRVTGLSVTAPTRLQPCDTTVTVSGVIRTNGGSGSVAYRWRRSDGQVSGVFTDETHKGRHSMRVPLRWTVKGPGEMHAVATLEIVRPASATSTASAGFDYACR